MGKFFQGFRVGGVDPQTPGTIYKAEFQSNLLFRLETWVMTPIIGRTLRRFHHRVTRCLVRMQMKWYMAGQW